MGIEATSIQGGVGALSAAFLWSIAAVLYSQVGRVIPPLELNLVKGVLAMSLLGLTIVATGDGLATGAPRAVGWLLVSGALGIGLGDTAYFEALVGLGPRRGLLMGVLAPPLAGLIALLFLGEALGVWAWLGIGLTLAGVAWVIAERTAEVGAPAGNRLWRGVGFGLLAALAQASGAVLSRAALTQSEISPLWSAFLRMGAGLVVLAVWIGVRRVPVGRWLQGPERRQIWPRLAVAVVAGTYLGIWLSQVAFQQAPAGVAQTLLSTSPLFVLPLAAWSGEKVTARAVLGVLLALAGVGLLFGAG